MPTALVIIPTPNGTDRVNHFTASLQPARFERLDRNRARTRADGMGELSWNDAVPLRQDGLGLIWLEASRLYGRGMVELEYDGGLENDAVAQ